jgi:hypothetical protein
MSTRAFSPNQCPDQEALVSFLYDEFDGSEAFDRRGLTKHVETCERCARILASLGGVRQRLRAWEAPDTSPLAFRIASDASVRHASGATFGWAAWMKPAFPLAAAAAIVLGAALGLARLDVQYDKDGFRVRTGWGHDAQTAGGTVTPALGVTSTPSIAGVTNFLSPVQNQNRAVTQQDLQAFAQMLRQEMAASAARLQAQDASGRGAPVATSASEVAFLKRVQQMIDQSEVRQQQNLALRVTELSRDFDLQRQTFDLQRRSDLAQIEQGFGKLAGQRELDAQQQRLLLNAIRTSQQIPVAPR